MEEEWTEKEVDEALGVLANEGYDGIVPYLKELWIEYQKKHKCKILGNDAVTDIICIKLCRYHLKDCHYVRNKVMKMKEERGVEMCGYSVEGHCNTVNTPIGENELCGGKRPQCPSYWIHGE